MRRNGRGNAWVAAAVAGLVGLAWLAAGCVKVDDTLTLNADGSGTVEIETVSLLGEMGAQMGRGNEFGPGQAPYPPMSEEHAKTLFPGDDFTVKTEQKKTEAGETATVVKVTFKDVNKLLASPYAQAHSLWMGVDAGKKTLTVRALTGVQMFSGLDFAAPGMDRALPPGQKDMREKIEKLHAGFTVKLPGAIRAEGAVVKGNTATWTVDRSVFKETAKLNEALRTTMTATCPADAIRFTPASPMRIAVLTFAEIKEGPTGAAPPAVDAAKILAAAKFVPLVYQARREFDFSGRGYGGGNSTSLSGVITLPKALAPQSWGTVEVSEAVDDQGNNLKLADRDNRYGGRRGMGRYGMGREKSEPEDTVRQVVSISLRTPPPAVRTIKRIKASIDLNYPGTGQVVKMKDAFKGAPAPAAGDAADENQDAPAVEDENKPASNPMLDKLGIKIDVSNVSFQQGMTRLSVRRSGKKTVLKEVQVYDAQGKPWPTMTEGLGDRGGDDETSWVTVAGRPEGLLSLVLVMDAGGPTVQVPIALRDLSVVPNEMKTPAEEVKAGGR